MKQTLVLGIAGIVLFFLTQNIATPMAMVDQWTIWNALVFVATVAFFALGIIKGKARTILPFEGATNR